MARIFLSDKIMVTEDGGIAVSLVNKSGATSVKGTLVYPSGGNDAAFDLTPVDSVDTFGIVYGDDAGGAGS